MNKEIWKPILLKYILSIGAVTLVGFTFVYLKGGNKLMAIIEGLVALSMVLSIFWIKQGKYLGPAVVGWLGIFFVFITLLFTGGIAGGGATWWSLMPIISFMLFGVTGGIYATSVAIVTLLGMSVLSQLHLLDLYFNTDTMQQTAVVLLVLGFIMYYFEKISSAARDDALVKSELLEDITKDLEVNIRELESEKISQENTRKAILNILEDTIDLDKELKVEKAGIEGKVVERTAQLQKANDAVNKGWLQIRQEKAKLLASIESLSGAYILLDIHKNVILKNKSANIFLNKENQNILFEDVEQKFKTAFNFTEVYEECISSKKVKYIKEILLGEKYYSLHVSPVFEGDLVIGILLTVLDITEQKIIDRSRDEFFSIASHELRTPLTAIRGNSSMIKDMYLEKIKDDDLSEMINDIHDSAVRLIGIVNDFLNVSRLEMGKMQFKKEPFDMEVLIKKTVDEIDDKKDQVQIKINNDSLDIPKVVGDSDRAKEVLINLIGNAVKFSEKGVVTIDYKTDSKVLTVFVTDTGRGIAIENQNLLFHKFQQAGDNLLTRDTTKSTGLGLYISKLMAEGMGGKIWLEKSEVGKGSTFAFSLPTAI